MLIEFFLLNQYNNNILISGRWDNTLLFYDIRSKEVNNYLYGAHICGDGMDIKDNYLLTVSWEKKIKFNYGI